MKIRKKTTDWWETFLYAGIFLLLLVFIYELLKLWNAGQVALNGWLASIGQALSNAIGTIETALNTLVTAPAAFFSNLFSAFPNFLNLVTGFFSAIFSGLVTGSLLSSIFGPIGTAVGVAASATAPLTTGLGSAASGSSPSGVIQAPTPIAQPSASTYTLGDAPIAAVPGSTFAAPGGN
jgi:hypothetical protein